jgi:hypothetical protein
LLHPWHNPLLALQQAFPHKHALGMYKGPPSRWGSDRESRISRVSL